MISKNFYFHPYLGKWSSLTNIFQMGWNHQLARVRWNITTWNPNKGLLGVCWKFGAPLFSGGPRPSKIVKNTKKHACSDLCEEILVALIWFNPSFVGNCLLSIPMGPRDTVFFLVSNQRFELLDLCMVMFYGFYHGKSSLNHHLGEFFYFFRAS